MGTKTNVFSKKIKYTSKENNNIARGHMGYRWRNVISDCKKMNSIIDSKTSNMALYFLL